MKTTSVEFAYRTALGRFLLRIVLRTHMDRIAVAYLKSPLSRPLIGRYIKKHRIPMDDFEGRNFRTFRDFFARRKADIRFDMAPGHLISPCDSFLSAYRIEKDSIFNIKGTEYSIKELIGSQELAEEYSKGLCLMFRLCASDYHHYCYLDDGYQGKNHYIPGSLHSVQPAAYEKYPVFKTNRRTWTLLATENFGPVIQVNVGAFVVGGIVNLRENARFSKGSEMGYFDLCGSTIVLLFKENRISLLSEIEEKILHDREARVTQGMWIADAICEKNDIYSQNRTIKNTLSP